MDRWVAVVLMVGVGAAIALQPPVNAGLARETGQLPAALISFVIGTLLLLILVAAIGELGNARSATEVRWYYLLGGVFGALWVATSLIAVKALGAGGVVAATITGQLTGALVADALGILSLSQIPITPLRVLGVVLLLTGTYLVVR
jgi:transporter family-2 protein